MSAQLALRDALLAALARAPALADQVQANRRRPVPAEVNTAVFVYLEQSAATAAAMHGDGRVDWATQIRIEALARRHSGIDADDAADALADSVYARIHDDPYLAGALIEPIEVTGMGWAEDEVDGQLSGVQLLATCKHRTLKPTLAAAN